MRLLLLIVSIGGTYPHCIFLHCVTTARTAPCANCNQCRENATNLCFSGSGISCGCSDGHAGGCERFGFSDEIVKICKVHETVMVPVSVVRPQGEMSVSVVVQRFFSEPPFDAIRPSRLVLLADFATTDKVTCVNPSSEITAEKWSRNHCILRIRFPIPGVDHKSEDPYYYDDQTDLEAEFSVDMFGQANSVRFWVEVTVERQLQVANESVRFLSVIRSDPVVYKLNRPTWIRSSERRRRSVIPKWRRMFHFFESSSSYGVHKNSPFTLRHNTNPAKTK